MDQFAATIDFIEYNARQLDGYNILLASKHENCWSLNVIRHNDLTTAQVSHIEKDILPRLARHTKGTFSKDIKLIDDDDGDSDSDEEDEEENLLVDVSDGAGQSLIDEISTNADPDLLVFTRSAENRLKDDVPTADLIDFGNESAALIDLGNQSVALIDFGDDIDHYSGAPQSQLDDIIAELETITFADTKNDVALEDASVAMEYREDSISVNKTSSDPFKVPAKPLGKRKLSVSESTKDDVLFTPVGNASLFTPEPVSRYLDPQETPVDVDMFATPCRSDIEQELRILNAPHKALLAAGSSDDEDGTDFATACYQFMSRKKILEKTSQFDDVFRLKKIPRLSFDVFDPSTTATGGVLSSSTSIANKLAADIPRAAPQGPSSATTLVDTPTLRQLDMKYNVQYNMVYCNECQGGYMFGAFVHHAYKGSKRIMNFDPVRKTYSQPKQFAKHMRLPLLKGAKVKKTSNQIVMRDDEVEGMVIRELRSLGYDPKPVCVKQNDDKAFRREWNTVHCIPRSDQVGPIEGPKVYPHAFSCRFGDCAEDPFPYCCLTKESMRGHFREQHEGSTKDFAKLFNPGPQCQVDHGVTVQTICASNAWALFFKVPSGDGTVNAELDANTQLSLTLTEILAQEQDELFGGLQSEPDALDPDLIHPAYRSTGMAGFWARFDPQVLASLKKIVVTTRLSVLKEEYVIRQAIMATFLDICLHAQSAKAHVLKLIMEGCRGKKGSIFTIPKPTTLRLYVDVEILLLRWLVHDRKHQIKDRSGQPLFMLDDKQKKSLESLFLSARRKDPIKVVASKLVDLFHRLYFPHDIDRSTFDAFLEPAVAFFAILSLTNDMAPRPLKDVPHYCSRLQFSMRLRGYHFLFTSYSRLYPEQANAPRNKGVLIDSPKQKKEVTRGNAVADRESPVPSNSSDDENDPDATDEDYRMPSVEDGFESGLGTMTFKQVETQDVKSSWWHDKAVPFCEQYLSEDEATPFGWIRTVMREFSAAVRHSRKRPQVKWVSSERLFLDNRDISLAGFKTHFLFRLTCLEEFFRDELLFGKTLDQLGILVDFNALGDSGDDTTIGYCPLMGSVDGNEDSTNFLQSLLSSSTSGMVNLAEGDIVWNQAIAEEWIFNIHKANGETHAATHISQGAAGRITEEAKMQISNTTVGRRHLFLTPGLNTLCLWSDYWKGSSKSGTFKEVLRVIPYRVARLLFILNRIIRPLALRYLAKYRIASDMESRAALYTTYKSRLWASLGTPFSAKNIYQSFPLFLHSEDAAGDVPFDFPFGPRLYRQFVVAVQRKHIKMPVRYTPEMMKEEGSVGDAMAGRSTETSLQEYAVIKCIINRSPGFLNHYIEYSKRWHEFLGLSTERTEGEQYLV